MTSGEIKDNRTGEDDSKHELNMDNGLDDPFGTALVDHIGQVVSTTNLSLRKHCSRCIYFELRLFKVGVMLYYQ